MKNLKGLLTVSSVQSSRGKDYVSIKVIDDKSCLYVMEAKVDFAPFARALTGLGRIPCKLTLCTSERIGKKREVKKVEVVIAADLKYERAKESQARKILKAHEIDGWKGDVGSLNNHHNFTKDGVMVLFERWV